MLPAKSPEAPGRMLSGELKTPPTVRPPPLQERRQEEATLPGPRWSGEHRPAAAEIGRPERLARHNEGGFCYRCLRLGARRREKTSPPGVAACFATCFARVQPTKSTGVQVPRRTAKGVHPL